VRRVARGLSLKQALPPPTSADRLRQLRHSTDGRGASESDDEARRAISV